MLENGGVTMLLVGTPCGCQVYSGDRQTGLELTGRAVSALTAEPGGSCLAIVDGFEIWRRSAAGLWRHVTRTAERLQALMAANGHILAGGEEAAILLRIDEDGAIQRVFGFDRVSGRDSWFAGGPPLGVRSLSKNADGSVLLAAVHVGGIPRSTDHGETWTPTIPILFDVHEVCAHLSKPEILAAATAIGLCISRDAGRSWQVLDRGLTVRNCFAVAVTGDRFLFGISDGPFAMESELWSWTVEEDRIRRVRNGLPKPIPGKIDTGQIDGTPSAAAFVDGAGTLWLMDGIADDWQPLAQKLPYPATPRFLL